MKIRRVTCTEVIVPLKKPAVWAYGTRRTAPALLVEIETDKGVTGLGEGVGPTISTLKTITEHDLVPMLIGEDPLNIERLMAKMAGCIQWYRVAAFAVSGVEMALLDLKAKVLKTSVANLLGGVIRNPVKWMGYLFIQSPDEDAKEAMAYAQAGFTELKVKVGRDPNVDVDRIRAIRQAVGPRVAIRIDPNQKWSPKTAVKYIRKMEKFDLQMVEQPTPWQDYEGLAYVRNHVDAPITADESCGTLQDALALIRLKAVDCFTIYISKAGGMTRAREIARVAEESGIPCVLGTWAELGVGTAAQAHLVASTKNFPFANDTHYTMEGACVLKKKIEIVRGATKLDLTKPGLGVELDRAKVKKAATSKLKESEFGDDAGAEELPTYGQFL